MASKSRILLPAFFLLGTCIHVSSQGIKTTTGANLVVNGAAKIVVSDGGFSNSGVFIAGSGTVKLAGTASSAFSFVSGSSVTDFYDFEINKTSGSAKLLRNITVGHNVVLSNTDVDLNGFDIDLGSTGSLSGETTVSQISGINGGAVIRTLNLNAPSAVNPGNIGLEISSTANLGPTTIKRGNVQQVIGNWLSIQRYFDVVATNNNLLNAKIKFHYVDDELAGLPENSLTLYGSPDYGSTWSLLGHNSLDILTDTLSKIALPALNRFTLAPVNISLPVKLLFFSAERTAAAVVLKWASAFEINNSHYELERSSDGRNFEVFAKVIGAGNSSLTTNYDYTDTYIFSGIMYYRLRQVDADGKFSYSRIVAVNKSKYTNQIVNVFPNPVGTEPLQVRFTADAHMKGTLVISDIKGRVLISRDIIAEPGVNNTLLDMSALPSGSYYLKLQGIDNRLVKIARQ